jgi:hypothetical protein
MSMFNTEQQEHINYINSLQPEEKCWCGWYILGECYNCNKDKVGLTNADRIKNMCPECSADLPYHRITCSKSV